MVSIEIDDSLTGLVKSQLQKLGEIRRPEDYFYLTELVNPIQAYWDRMDRIEPETDILQKMNLGTRIHRLAGYWFRDIEGFEYPEAKLDGIWVGIDGVRGKIDFRFGDSVLEIKSKPDPVEDSESIISDYPHDLEQLLFYASISTISTDTHYLVFVHDEQPHPITFFRVKVKDIEPFKNLLRQRIEMLRTALTEEDPASLGRCRYHPQCQYLRKKKCNCEDIDPLDTHLLTEYLEIERDTDMENFLMEKREEVHARFIGIFNPFQLLFPRKWFKEEVLALEGTWERSALRVAQETMLWKAVSDIEEIRTSPSDRLGGRKTGPIPVTFPSTSMKYLESGKEPTVIPYITKVSRVTRVEYTRRPHDIPLAQLAVICGLTNSSKGVIFVQYPDLEDRIIAYVAKFNDVERINVLIDEQIHTIEDALEKEDPNVLPVCMDFMRDLCGDGCLCKN
jgi:hypothetical protein